MSVQEGLAGRLSLGECAMVGVDETEVSATAVGAGANVAFYGAGPLSAGEGDPSGKQGSMWYWNMGAGTSGQQRGLRFKVYGRAVGLRYRNYVPNSITLPTIAVIIDGKVYPVPRQATYFRAQPQLKYR
jgi:hypothetical protein